MARVEREETWQVTGDVGSVRAKLDAFFAGHRMKVTVRGEEEIHADQGSQFTTRLLGGWFVSPTAFPKRAVIRLQGRDGAVEVSARIEEALGFGVLDRKFKKRYEAYFETWIGDLKHALG